MANIDDLLRQAATHVQSGQWQAAEAMYRQAQVTAPSNLHARDELAWLLLRTGRGDEALAELKTAIELAPTVAPLQTHLGMMFMQIGRPREAIACYERAIALQPDDAAAPFNLGNAFSQIGDFVAALGAYRLAASLSPLDADIYLNQAIAQRALGQLEEARASLQRVVELKPYASDGWNNLGVLARTSGDEEEAERCYQQALQVDPASARAYNNLGSLAQSQFRSTKAVAYFQRALRLQSNYVLARANLGDANLALGNVEEARATYTDLLAQAANDAVEIKLELALPIIPTSQAHIDQSRRQLVDGLERLRLRALAVADPVESIGLPAFYLAYQGYDECETQRRIAEVVRQASPQLAFIAPHCLTGASTASRPCKIGFISRHFHDHTISKLNRGLIQHLDRGQFHVSLLRFPGRNDRVAESLTASADSARTLSTKLSVAQQQIADCELDILFYTDIGMDSLTYYLAHARLAPVQCVTWGHPLTTGIPTIDYFVSSDDLELPGSEAHYSEALVRLPQLANYYFKPVAAAAVSRDAWGFSEQDHLYACPQSLFKLHPDDDHVFGRILQEDPRGKIVLLEGQQTAWSAAVRQRQRQTLGSLCERICFVPRMLQPQFQQLLATVDLLLDPLHFGGGNSSYEAFALGTPIVTLPGPYLRSRITYALYRTMGIVEGVAHDVDDYVARAIRLGSDRSWRQHVRDQILAKNHLLYEAMAGVKALEGFLLSARPAR